MRKNLTIFASILFVAGGSALGWVLTEMKKDREQTAYYKSNYGAEKDDYVKKYNEWLQTPSLERTKLPMLFDENGETKTREQLWQEQQGRLRADLDDLAVGEIAAPSFADVLYGDDWQSELGKYKKRKDLQSLVLTSSIVCMSLGGLVYLWWLVRQAARVVARAVSGLKRHVRNRRGTAGEDVESEQAPEDALEDQKAEDLREEQKAEDVSAEQKDDEKQEKAPPRPRITVKPVIPTAGETERKPLGSLTQRPKTTREREKIVFSASDDTYSSGSKSAVNTAERQKTHEQSKPIDNTLNDLTQQVSAIREYAAHQQDRLEKLQDGYDWNIIRTFCLRVIRAVDNLDSRIARLRDDDADVTHLEEVKDELIFALESSGIEQFEPDTNIEYRGQEKFAEAIKEKKKCDDPKQTGKIADVVRPGYQYFIDEENVKIVRPAQVRLYA